MNKLGILVFLTLCCALTASAQEPIRAIRSDSVVLFDGSSLEGWTNRKGKSPGKGWVIDEEGNLHRSEKAGDLYHESWYKDFELVFQWKIAKGGNSGVKYRVKDYGKQSLGCEYQLQDDAKCTKHSTGGLYALYAPSEDRQLNPVGEWNETRIIVCGNRVEHWLNSKMTVSATFGSSDWLERVAASKFNNREFFGQNEWGRIFLQDHGTPVWFRNITITPLICIGQSEFQPASSVDSTIPTQRYPILYSSPVVEGIRMQVDPKACHCLGN